MDRQLVSTGTIWEERVGYSRAVRVGQHVFVAGTLAIDDDGNLVGLDDADAQASFIFQKIGRALEAAGSSLADVVRTRMFVIDFAHEQAVGRAHGRVFKDIRPAATMVGTSGLAHKDALVEIEAEAVIR